MTQRVKHCPNSLNLETLACEKYISRLLQREKSSTPSVKSTIATVCSQRNKEKLIKQGHIALANQNQLSKARPNVKQQNLPSPKSNQSPTRNILQYADDSALVEVTVKTTNPRQRSKSTVADREPWGQLLKQQRSNDKVSLFSNFDPLRTLHFLAKELHYQLETILPDNATIQQMVTDMQYALKRVPPEVASTIHLQQAIDLLPSRKCSKCSNDDKPEKLKPSTTDTMTQTSSLHENEQSEKLRKIMEESTMKLEASCKQMETLCEQLKHEKELLEGQLKAERDSAIFLKKRIDDLEFENTEILSKKIKNLEDEKRKLQLEVNTRNSSSMLEQQEISKLKHQLKVSALEKEKFIAILALRDRQINEIRTEMTDLQEVVNEQLMELHNSAFTRMPNSTENGVPFPWNFEHNKENIGDIGDATLSTIHSNEDQVEQLCINKPNHSFRDLPSGDNVRENILHEISENYYGKNTGGSIKDINAHLKKAPDSPPYLERPDSQASIRSMFSELKKTAYTIISTPRHSQLNLNSNKQ